MTQECCLTHGLILPCHDCALAAQALRVCSTCEAPVSFDEDLLDDAFGRRHHSDPTECSAMFNSSGYRDEQIAGPPHQRPDPSTLRAEHQDDPILEVDLVPRGLGRRLEAHRPETGVA